MYSKDPALIVERQQEVTLEALARQYDAKQALHQHYQRKAEQVGMTLQGYCQRFGVRLPDMAV